MYYWFAYVSMMQVYGFSGQPHLCQLSLAGQVLSTSMFVQQCPVLDSLQVLRLLIGLQSSQDHFP